MERSRASSLETNSQSKKKHNLYADALNKNNIGRSRMNSLLCNQRDSNEDCGSLDFSYGREKRKPMVSNSELKVQLDLLQCTVNKMLNVGEVNEVGSSCPPANISNALKHEYRQMISALKELETILSLKRKSVDTMAHPNITQTNNSQVHQLQHEIYCRDSLIKTLTDRLKVLCKANDKLIIDYENQESMLSEELLCLKRQLENAKDALRALAIVKKRSSITSNQNSESDVHYLRESLCTKEMIIADLTHRVERLNRENSNLKCELENRDANMTHCLPASFDRESVYLKHLNDQMKEQIDSLSDSLELKKCLINDLQNQLECRKDEDLNRHLRQKLLLLEDENELHKDEIMQQREILEDCRNQIQILSENSCFKDDTIDELKACLRNYTDIPRKESVKEVQFQSFDIEQRPSSSDKTKNNSLAMLLTSIKKHLSHHHPELLDLLVSDPDVFHELEKFVFDLSDMVSQPSSDGNDIELFKEFLTNEINLKNKIAHFLTSNIIGNIESVEKLQHQLNSLLSIDMDDGFKDDLKKYLHQCYLSDDNLRLVVEYLVKFINNIPAKNLQDTESVSRSTFMEDKEVLPPLDSNIERLKSIEEELQRVSLLNKSAKESSAKEIQKVSDEKENLESSYNSLQNQYKKLLAELTECRNKNDELERENDKLKNDNQGLLSKMKQMERDLNMQTSELDHLEKSMKSLSNKFVNFNDDVKDAEIERLSNKMEGLLNEKKSLEKERIEQFEQMSLLSKDSKSLKDLQSLGSDMEKVIKDLQKQLKDMQDKLAAKDKELNDLQSKLAEEMLNSAAMKSLQDRYQQLLDKLAKCMEDKSNMELNIKEMRLQMSEQEHSKDLLLKSSIQSLNMENKSLEMRSNSLNSEKSMLNSQIKQLKNQIEELMKHCAENHVDKTALRKDSTESDICKQKIIDLEAILALMTEELNEKVQSLEEIRQMIKRQPLIEVCSDIKCPIPEPSSLSQHLLSQKESEISHLRSKLESIQLQKTMDISKSKTLSLDNSETVRCKQAILELEMSNDLLKEQLNDRSDTIAQLQQLLKERDCVIENAGKMMKTKNDSLVQSERLSHLMSLQNANIKSELSASYDWKSELDMLKSLNGNLRDEIQLLKQDNCRLKEELRNLAMPEHLLKMKSLSCDMMTQNVMPLVSDSSVVKINEEVQKLYSNFEDKKNELKDYSIKEIKARDNKIEDLNFELKLKADQIQKIIIENRRLSDKIDDESQKTNNYEQNLQLKEQLLQKLLKEKEKIRATFITELRDKNEELKEKSNTVYFLNAEIHRLSSDLEILDASLHTVKAGENFAVKQSRILEISQAELNAVKEENTSLKFCVNMKMSETEAAKNEIIIQQIGNKQLNDEINILKSEMTERENRLSKTFEENGNIKRQLSNLENDALNSIDSLQTQLKHAEDDNARLNDTKMKLENAVKDLSDENRSLKHIMEELENEKMGYRDEVEKYRGEVDMLNYNLTESNEMFQRVSEKIENEQENGRRLSIVIDLNEKSKISTMEDMNHLHQQLDDMSKENFKLRNEIEHLTTIIRNMEHHETESLTQTDQYCKTIKELERKIRSLEIENEGMNKELTQYQHLEKQLDERIQRKTIDCEGLRQEHDELLQMLEKYQLQIDSIENKEQMVQLTLNEESSKCKHLQDHLEMAKQQLLNMEEKWTCCNNSWIDKYGQLRNKFEKLECDLVQQQHHNDTITLDQKMLDVTIENQRQELICLNSKNHQLSEECSKVEQENLDMKHLKCDNNSLREYNSQMSSQIESLTKELVGAHTEIWNAQLKINENQATISKLCSRLNNKLTSDRRYGSQPLLNRMDLCGASLGDLEQRDYNDLKTRYNALCSQIDTMVCQLKKKDKRIVELEASNEVGNFNSLSHEQLKSDYDELERKYQRLQIEFSNMAQQYHFNSLEHLENQSHVVQAYSEEFNEALRIKNQELDQLRSAHHILADDYHGCCERLREFEIWQSKCNEKAESFKYLESEFKELRRQNDCLLLELAEKNNLKQELMDMSNRVVDVMNCNSNLEQQLANYHQKAAEEHRIIEDLNSQLMNLESFYECEVEKCRKDIVALKGGDVSFRNELAAALDEKNHQIDCLNAEIKFERCELVAMHDKYNCQSHQLETVKERLCHEKMTKKELQQEYEEQCNNIDQLSAQLFDSRDLIERLTMETRRMASVIDEKQNKINQLGEKIDHSDECLRAKDNEIRENQRSVSLLENNLSVRDDERRSLLNQIIELTDQNEMSTGDEKFGKELAICYQMIESLKEELTKLNDENEKINSIMHSKDRQICDYDQALALSAQELEHLRGDLDNRRMVSATELCKLNDVSHKLSGELNYLQQKICADIKSQETQTSEHEKDNLQSQSPVSKESTVTYTTTKSPTAKATNTENEGIEDGVVALQQAIEEYNSLVSEINAPDNKTKTSKTTSLEHETPDIIFVDVDSDMPGLAQSRKMTSALSNNEKVSVHEIDSPKMFDVVQLLKNLNVDYDGHENPEVYIGRVMERYKELEQYFLASVKIQLNQPLEDDTLELFDNFSENVDNTKTILKEQCRQLNEMIISNVMDINDDVGEVSAKHMTVDDVKGLIGLVKTKQMQMGAINVGYNSLHEVTPFSGSKAGKISVAELSAPYEKIWESQELCTPVVRQDSVPAVQRPVVEMLQKEPSVVLHISETDNHDIKNDSLLKRLSSKDLSKDRLEKRKSHSVKLNVAENNPPAIETDTLTQKLPSMSAPDSPVRSITERLSKSATELSHLPSTQYHTPETSKRSIYQERIRKLSEKEASQRAHSNSLQRTSCNRFGTESKMHTFRDDSYLKKNHGKDLSDSYKNTISSRHMSTGIEKCRPHSVNAQATEARTRSIHESLVQSGAIKGSLDNVNKITDKTQSTNAKERTQSQTTKVQATESRVKSPQEDALQKVSNREAAIRPSDATKKTKSIQNELSLDLIIPLENVQNRKSEDGAKSASPSVKQNKVMNSASDSLNIVSIDYSMKLRTAIESNISEVDDTYDKEPVNQVEHHSLRSMIKDTNDKNKKGQVFVQNASEGLSIKEGKIKSISKLDENVGRASVGNIVKDMHQLSQIDFNNIDSSIDCPNKNRIYCAEIDYLNEKNLFHSYAINVLTDPSRYAYNTAFLDQVNASLTAKAKQIELLQTEFKYTSHLSDNEKALMAKVLGSNYTYKGQFDDWIKLQKQPDKKRVNIDNNEELKTQLELCRSSKAKDAAHNENVIKDLQAEKETLRAQVGRISKIEEENEKLKNQIKSSSGPVSKSVSQMPNINANKPSKIPLMKGSNVEASLSKGANTDEQYLKDAHLGGPFTKTSNADRQTINVLKPMDNNKRLLSQDESPGNKLEKVSAMRISPGQLVTPEEVRKAISGEVSIENLRRFANLLAEDNFDLSAEIEKLLMTIEKLRRQLKDNCDILSETVEMLQNSENFVNDLEKRLSLETKKTQNISNRVDKLNELNKLVIAELQRILKGKAPPVKTSMDIQETCNYLLDCLKKLELENMELLQAKEACEIPRP